MSKKKRNEIRQENGFEDWGGYMAAKQAKLEEQFHSEANKEVKTSNIFEGISIFVNGYTSPTADELRHLMMTHGGTYHHYMRSKLTTHVIASNLPYSKIVMYRKSQNPIPICKPEWITDSIKAGKLLNFQNYLLYSQCTDVQPKLKYAVKNKAAITALETNTQKCNEADNPEDINISRIESVRDPSTSNSVVPVSSRDAQSSKHPAFISEFYSHSRLHHIATMGATFKDYVNELRDKNNGEFPGLNKLRSLRDAKLNASLSDSQLNFDLTDEDKIEIRQNSVIMHIDMDCFFVSVGLRDKPELRGLPVAVTHAKGNKNRTNSNEQNLDSNKDEDHGSLSEIASCSYEARKAGVKNGMFLGEALKICPNLKTIPYNFDGYNEVSYTLYDTVASYTLDIEAVSCDEMYADCTKLLREFNLTPMEFAKVIRQEIKEKTSCPVSTGFGGNKLLARLATKKAKPDGQFYIQQEQINDCISSLNVQDLPGVGWTTAHKLKNINVRTCAELQTVSLAMLQKEFGKKTGEMLYNMCRGVDNSKLNLEHVRKSVSAEVNYGIRFETDNNAIDFLKKLSQEICNRLNKANAKGRCITLKVLVRAKEAPRETEKFMGHGLCDYITKSKNLISPINDVDIITKEVITLWNQIQKPPEDARGIGIQISRLEILKTKSRNATITSFVNKQNSKVNAFVETESLTNLNSNNAAINEQDFYVPFDINESILSELPEEIRNEISNISKSKNLVKTNETESLPNLNTKNSAISQQDFYVPSDINESILSELPEEIRNEISNISKSKNLEKTNKTESLPNLNTKNVAINEQDFYVPSDINESILAELPEEIRNEISNISKSKNLEKTNKTEPLPNSNAGVSNSKNVNESNISDLPEEIRNVDKSKNLVKSNETDNIENINKKSSQTKIQTRHENFFKQTKSSISRPKKVEMPPIQEIDMSVLIELPESIRNEILNEYSAKKNSSVNENQISTSSTSNSVPTEINRDEQSISFSQVDPEFLAALSEDQRHDVQMYCYAKKAEKDKKLKKEEINCNIGVTKNENIKLNKIEQNVKNKGKGKGGKVNSKNKQKTKNMIKLTKSANECENASGSKNDNVTTSCIIPFVKKQEYIDSKVTADEAEAILSHNRTISEDNDNVNEHQDVLIHLVNHLHNLPLKQVKMQIQMWITNSKVVNEVDFLSLATFLSMLPGKRRIEDLHILLKTMHRCMTKSGNCIWHRTYRKTVKYVQHYMQIEYNSNLMVPPIKCNLLQCNSNV